jgi:vancomycin resistance protein YoaR
MQIRSSVPTRLSSAVFGAQASFLRLARGVQDRTKGLVRFPAAAFDTGDDVLAESITRLFTPESVGAERVLTLGKIENLRIAAQRLHGVVIPAHQTFSFWRHVGRVTRRAGYVRGREIREGCLVPSIGGGLCQLSNALYDAALRAHFTIVERHAHTAIVAGSFAAAGRDATVFWNYVDLRFRAAVDVQIEATLTADSLIVRFRGSCAETQVAIV